MAKNITIADINYNDVPSIQVPLQTTGYATYADTSDADAVAGDISLGKTAYVDGVKLVGTGTGGGQGGEYDIIATITGDTQSLAIVDAEHVITIEPLSVTANGTYTAPTDHAYTPVTVNVPATPTQTKTETITSNGTTTITPDSGYNLSSVSVITNVPNPSVGRVNITNTSVVDVSTYAEAQVVDANLTAANIAKDVVVLGITGTHEGGITPTGTLDITTNGTHDVANYASANVNVPAPSIILQDKTITTNGSYTADSGYDGLGTVSVNVQGSLPVVPSAQNYLIIGYQLYYQGSSGSHAIQCYRNKSAQYPVATYCYSISSAAQIGQNIFTDNLIQTNTFNSSQGNQYYICFSGPIYYAGSTPKTFNTISDLLENGTLVWNSNIHSITYSTSSSSPQVNIAVIDANTGTILTILNPSNISSYQSATPVLLMGLGGWTGNSTTGITLTIY